MILGKSTRLEVSFFTAILVSTFSAFSAQARTSYSVNVDEAAHVATHTLFSDGGRGFGIFKQLNLTPACKDGTPPGGDQSGSYGSCDKFANGLASDPSFQLSSFVAQAQTGFSLRFSGREKIDLNQPFSESLPDGVNNLFSSGQLQGDGFTINCTLRNCGLNLVGLNDVSEFAYSVGNPEESMGSPRSFSIRDFGRAIDGGSKNYYGLFTTDIAPSDISPTLAKACILDVRECSIYFQYNTGKYFSLGQIDIVADHGTVKQARVTIALPLSLKLFTKNFVQKTKFYLPTELTERIKKALVKGGGGIAQFQMANEFLTLRGTADGRISASLDLPSSLN